MLAGRDVDFDGVGDRLCGRDAAGVGDLLAGPDADFAGVGVLLGVRRGLAHFTGVCGFDGVGDRERGVADFCGVGDLAALELGDRPVIDFAIPVA